MVKTELRPPRLLNDQYLAVSSVTLRILPMVFCSGHVIMYADRITDSMKRAIDETYRRRDIQDAHNREHGIEPQSIQKEVHDITEGIKAIAETRSSYRAMRQQLSRDDMFRVVKDLEAQMKESARNLQFEKAAQLRDEMLELRKLLVAEEKTLSG